jgi:hypothetical protein
MEMQQTIERLLASQEHMKEKMDANLKEMMARLEAIQAETKIDREEMLEKIDTNQERLNASLREEIKFGQAEMRIYS